MDVFTQYDQDRNENSQEKEAPNADTKEEIENVSSPTYKKTITYQDYINQLNSHYGQKLDFVASVGGNKVLKMNKNAKLLMNLIDDEFDQMKKGA